MSRTNSICAVIIGLFLCQLGVVLPIGTGEYDPSAHPGEIEASAFEDAAGTPGKDADPGQEASPEAHGRAVERAPWYDAGAGPPATVEIDPYRSVTLGSGQSWVFTAIARDEFGNLNTSWTPVWSLDAGLGSLSDTGGLSVRYDARYAGVDHINVTCPTTGAWNRTGINVEAGPVEEIEIYTYPAVQLEAGRSADFLAVGRDALGNVNETWNDAWAMDGGSGTLEDLGEYSVRFSAETAGTDRVNVTCPETGSWNRTQVSVTPGDLESITVLPGVSDVPARGQLELTARGSDRFGNEAPLIDTVWETDAGEITRATATTAVLTAGASPLEGGQVIASQGAVSGTAVVNVLRTSDPPVIVGTVPNQKAGEDSGPWVLDLSKHCSDLQDPPSLLKWYIQGGDESLFRVEGENIAGSHTLTFVPLPDAYGNDRITIILKDSDGAKDRQDLWVNITPVNDAPVIEGLPPGYECREDRSGLDIDLSGNWYDVDDDAKGLSWEVLGWDPTLWSKVEVAGEDITFVPAQDAWGSDEVALVLSDGSLQDTSSVWVNVTPINDAPVLLPIPPQTGWEDEPWSLNLSLYCHDVDNEFNSLNFTTDTEEAYVTGTELVFTGSMASPPVVHLTVGDGELKRAIDIQLTIISREGGGGGSSTDGGDGTDGGGPGGTKEGDGPEPGTAGYYYVQVAEFINDYSYGILAVILFTFFTLIGFIYATVYRVEEVFLIHRTKGSVIHYLSHAEEDTLDKEVIGSMLTVLHSFVKDAFSQKGGADGDGKKGKAKEPDLTQFNVGKDKKVMIEVGEHLYLAIIYKGSRSRLRWRLKRVVARLEKRYGSALEGWDGDLDKLEGTKEIASKLLTKSITKDLGRRSAVPQVRSKARGVPGGPDVPSVTTDTAEETSPKDLVPGVRPKLQSSSERSDISKPKDAPPGPGGGSLLARLAAMDGGGDGGGGGPPVIPPEPPSDA